MKGGKGPDRRAATVRRCSRHGAREGRRSPSSVRPVVPRTGGAGTKLLSEEEIHQLTFSFQKILMNSRGDVGSMTKACPPEVTVQWGVSYIGRSCG